jgi:fatty-acyl-CoA synthase
MNISSWIEKWAKATPDKTAMRYEGRDISYREFDLQIKKNACMLKQGLGVQTGDRIAYLGHNHPQLLILFFACARLGAILVPLNWRLTPPEHLQVLKDCGAGTVFVDSVFHGQCESLHAELPGCRFVVLDGEHRPGWLMLDQLLDTASGDDAYPGTGPDDPVLIIYTSGTTGHPKGAVLTQRAIEVNAINSTVMHDMTSMDRILTFLPMFHVGGLNVQTMPGFHAGATVILHRIFNPEMVLDSIHHDHPTLTIILPAHMQLLETAPGWQVADFSCLRSVVTGSTAIPETMISYWHARSIPLIQLYGASETCPIAIHQHASNAFATEGSIGFPALHCDIRIVDDEGRDCDTDVPGEILVQGDNILSYYWNNEEATRNALRDGWYHSGDVGYKSADGCYYFLERKIDIIISGGENIYPAEIENLLSSHPDIAEAAVVSRDDTRWGEVPVAVVVVKDGSILSRQQVLDWFEGRLGRYKHPRDVIFLEALPRNEMRKVMKPELRKLVK